MRFIVIEGLDGSGKSTQLTMLGKFLEKRSVPYRYLHFPRLEEGIYGKLIARFLRGEMGDIDQVDPYLVALIFAGDRFDARLQIEKWIDAGYLVIVDRYVYSNIAFQGAKLKTPEDQQKLAKWIIDLEYGYHRIPEPDKNIFLNVPFQFTKKRLTEKRAGGDRTYLKGKDDIHEKDLTFQERVRMIYQTVCMSFGNLSIIDCSGPAGEMKRPEDIFSDLKRELGF
ncbi:MAG: dTMP kinase [Bacteroidales bacterium]|nr:dTMP kinase [Bacteroidales bacterium]